RAEARANRRPVGQHRLVVARMQKAIAVRAMPETTLQNISNETRFGSGAVAIEYQGKTPLLEGRGQLSLRHSRLDDGVGERSVDRDDPIHTGQIENKSAGRGRAGIAIAPVFSSADRIQRQGMFSGHAHDLLDLVA